MPNLSIIRDLVNEKKSSLKELCEKVGISQNGLQRIMADNSTKIDTLEKIALELGVPIQVFFEPKYLSGENQGEEYYNYVDQEIKINNLTQQIEGLKTELLKQEKDFAINMQENEDRYKNQISNLKEIKKLLESKVSDLEIELTDLKKKSEKGISRIATIMKFIEKEFPTKSHAEKFENSIDLMSKLNWIEFYELSETLTEPEKEIYSDLLNDLTVKNFKLFEKSKH